MKTKVRAKKSVAGTNLASKLKGAATKARRKAFKHDLPVVIYEEGKFFLIYRGKKKIEASEDEIKKILAKE